MEPCCPAIYLLTTRDTVRISNVPSRQSHKPSSQSCFYWGRGGPGERRGSSQGQRAHRGSRAPLALHRTGGRPGPTLGVRSERITERTQTTVAPVGTSGGPDQLCPLYVCWYTRSVHMSTSIDLGVRGACVSSAASPPGVFVVWFHPVANNVLLVVVGKKFT